MINPKDVLLIYGAGGIGKSSRAAEAAEYTFKTSGKKTRVVNADGGGTSSAFENLVDAGIAEIWNVDQWEGTFAALQLASLGGWPSNPQTPNSPILLPTREWRPCVFCEKDSGAKGLTMIGACAACKKPFPPGTILKVEQELLHGIEEVGLIVFEGMTAFGDLLLNRFRDIDKSSAAAVVKDGDATVVQVGMQHYLLAQNQLMTFFSNCRRIPVETILWTALELKSDEMGDTLYGPAGPGKKLTSLCIPKFTSVIHLDAVTKVQGGKRLTNPDGTEILERKMFLAPHYPIDAPGKRWVAKTSAPHGGGMPLVIESDMEVFFEELKKAKAAAKDKLLKNGLAPTLDGGLKEKQN